MDTRILHIDDDPLMHKIVASALGREPSIVLRSSTSGEEGLAILKDWPPDLILCDVEMPGMNGVDVLRRTKEITGDDSIKFIFTTARAHAADVHTWMALGAAAVITKPFKLGDLARTVLAHLDATDRTDAATAPIPVEYDFTQRLREDASALKLLRDQMQGSDRAPTTLAAIQACVHKLAGAAGVYEHEAVSKAASAVEVAVIEQSSGGSVMQKIHDTLASLIVQIEHPG